MPKNLIIFETLLAILVTCCTARAQGEGDKYVLDSLKMLLAVNTVECDIRIETVVEGKEHTARGSYKEQALVRRTPGQLTPFQRSTYRLHISMNSLTTGNHEPNQMTIVCRPSTNGDRSLVERYTFIEGEKEFSMIDLTRLEEKLKETNRELFFTQVSEVRNLGGLAGMMRQISRFYELSLPIQESLQDEEPIAALKLTGQLRSVHYKGLLSRFGGVDKKGEFPMDFPSDIEIWLGRHNDFPYKIRYLRRISEKSDRKELLFQETFFNVVLNGTPIPAEDFFPLTPPVDVFMKDDTNDFIKSLGL